MQCAGCGAGIWQRAGSGYRSLDAEAVQVCVDRVRELREQDAWLAGLPDLRGEVPAGAAGTTRFGDRTPNGRGASFRCGQCGEMAGVVRVTRTGNPVREPAAGGESAAAGWLSLDYFIGTIWHAAASEILDAVEALIGQGNVGVVGGVGRLSLDPAVSGDVGRRRLIDVGDAEECGHEWSRYRAGAVPAAAMAPTA